MCRTALTFWFTISTLLGPGMCCCSFGSSPFMSSAATKTWQLASSASPVKSCCDRDIPPCCPDGKRHDEPGKPSKCPCEKGKQLVALPSASNTTAEFSAQIRLLDAFLSGLSAPCSIDLVRNISCADGAIPPASRLAGRDLLAACSMLRC